MMRSLNTEDILGAQPKKVVVKQRYHSNQSTINLTTGEQILNPMSSGNKEQSSPMIEPPSGGKKGKKGFHSQQVDSIKNLMENAQLNEDQQAYQNDLGTVHLKHQNKSNNSDQFIINSGQQLNQLQLEQALLASPSKVQMAKTNNSSRGQQKLKASNQHEDILGNNLNNGKNIFQDKLSASTSDPALLSIKTRQKEQNLIGFDKSPSVLRSSGRKQSTEEIYPELGRRSQEGESKRLQQLKTDQKNGSLAYKQQQQYISSEDNMDQEKQRRLYIQGDKEKEETDSQILFYSDQAPISQTPKGVQIQRNMSKSLVSNGGLNLGQGTKMQSPFDSPEKNRKRDLLSQNGLDNSPQIGSGEKYEQNLQFNQSRQSGISNRSLQQQSPSTYSALKSKLVQSALIPAADSLSNTKDNSKNKELQTAQVLSKPSRDHRIVVVCDSCNSARDAINRFLQLRSLVGYEVFSLPGGPGSFLVEENDVKESWQRAFQVFLKTISRVYQIQEIQLYSSLGSLFADAKLSEGSILKNQIAFYDNLSAACEYVRGIHSYAVKGFGINQKGIVDKIC